MTQHIEFTLISVRKGGARRMHWGSGMIEGEKGVLTLDVPSSSGKSKQRERSFEFGDDTVEALGTALLKWSGKPIKSKVRAEGKNGDLTISQIYRKDGHLVVIGDVIGIDFMVSTATGGSENEPQAAAMAIGIPAVVAIVAVSAAIIAVAGAVAIVAVAASAGDGDTTINVNGGGDDDGDGDDGGGDAGGGEGGDGDGGGE